MSEAKCVAIVCAMRQELRPIVARFALPAYALGSLSAFRGPAAGREACAVVTTMGTRAARRATTALLDAFPADHVLIVGIAGGIAPSLRIGDLVHPESAFDEVTQSTVRPTPPPDVEPRGRLLTTDTLYSEAADVARLREAGFVAVDMETAAIGAVAAERGIPWTVFRAISDFAGGGVDASVAGLAHPDGSANPVAVARFVLTRPWRIPQLAAFGRGSSLAIRASTSAAIRWLEARQSRG